MVSELKPILEKIGRGSRRKRNQEEKVKKYNETRSGTHGGIFQTMINVEIVQYISCKWGCITYKMIYAKMLLLQLPG